MTNTVRSTVYGIFLCLALTIWSSVYSQSDRNRELRLTEVAEAWRMARMQNDTSFLERFYGKELKIIGSDGSLISRSEDIALYASGDLKPELIEADSLEIRIYGDVAILTGIERYRGKFKGISGEGAVRFMDVLLWRDKRWQLVASQGTDIVSER